MAAPIASAAQALSVEAQRVLTLIEREQELLFNDPMRTYKYIEEILIPNLDIVKAALAKCNDPIVATNK